MTTPTVPTQPQTAHAPLRVSVHALVAASIGVVSPFTGLAWPFALLVGMALGSADARRLRGERDDFAATLFIGIAVTGGILAMLFFGAIIGGVIAFAIVAMASFSERAAANASPTDRGVARILLFIVPVTMWLFLFPLLGMDVDIRFGS
jgi:hypothetical protein